MTSSEPGAVTVMEAIVSKNSGQEQYIYLNIKLSIWLLATKTTRVSHLLCKDSKLLGLALVGDLLLETPWATTHGTQSANDRLSNVPPTREVL